MGITSNKGMIFSTDAIIASTIILFSLLIFFTNISNYSENISKTSKQLILEEKTLLTADAFVKNYSPENALLGACKVDYEKKRVKSNEIESKNFSTIKQTASKKFFIKKITLTNTNAKNEKTIFTEEKNSETCITAKRLAFVDSEKTIVEITGCLIE
ncbi:MAG: hypothetical protein WC308_00350 [archaeon]